MPSPSSGTDAGSTASTRRAAHRPRSTPDVLHRQGLTEVPADGWLPVTVPGAVSAWVELVRRFGTMPLSRLLEPAARYAEEGHPVPPVIAGYWRRGAPALRTPPGFCRDVPAQRQTPRSRRNLLVPGSSPDSAPYR